MFISESIFRYFPQNPEGLIRKSTWVQVNKLVEEEEETSTPTNASVSQ